MGSILMHTCRLRMSICTVLDNIMFLQRLLFVVAFSIFWQDTIIMFIRSFPRLVGECGGKNFHLIHETADLQSVINGTLRSAFEYSGQKCSACSRVYVPESVWSQVTRVT